MRPGAVPERFGRPGAVSGYRDTSVHFGGSRRSSREKEKSPIGGGRPGERSEIPVGIRNLARGPEKDRREKQDSPTFLTESGAILLEPMRKNGRGERI